MNSPNTTIIIPQKNHVAMTIACVESLRLHESIAWPIVIVDDGSDREQFDITREKIAAFSNMRLLKQLSHGVSAAWNSGWNTADTKYVLFLNNDVQFHGPVIEQLMQPLSQPGVVISGVKLRSERKLPRSLLTQLSTLEFLEGWCFAVERTDVERLQGFDESMMLYWSDTDFQLRLLELHKTNLSGMHATLGLPLIHLQHQTAHHLPDYRMHRATDRATFIRKWKTRLLNVTH